MPKLKIKFHGVRGSLPRPSVNMVKYGGNTPCLEVRYGSELIICDCGTGLYDLSRTLPDKTRATILLSHYHWDHLIGLPFFAQLYNDESRLTIIGRRGLKKALSTLLGTPNFPVRLSQVNSRLRLVEKKAGEFRIGGLKIEAFDVNHPNGAFGYSFILPYGKKAVFISDNSPSPGDKALIDKIYGAEVLIHDAQYLPKEYILKRTFGHSPWQYALDLAKHGNVKKVMLFHHDPSRTDRELSAIEKSAKALARKIGLKASVSAAKEGITISI